MDSSSHESIGLKHHCGSKVAGLNRGNQVYNVAKIGTCSPCMVTQHGANIILVKIKLLNQHEIKIYPIYF